QLLPLDAFTVHESAVLAAKIDNEEVLAFRNNLGVIAGDAGIGDDQILVHLAAYVERAAVQNNVLLLATLHEDEGRKDSRRGAMVAIVTNGVQGHERARAKCFRQTALAASVASTDYSDAACCRKLSVPVCWVKKLRRLRKSRP